MDELFANSGDPDQMLLGLHCLPVTRLGVSSLQWDNMIKTVVHGYTFIFFINICHQILLLHKSYDAYIVSSRAL